jgi:hypothetical protein
MSLTLGKLFDRNYTMRIPFLDGHYNIGTFFNKRSTNLLFSVEPEFDNTPTKHGIKINMFKNLKSSKFTETFLNLHNFRKNTLDIMNQFENIKDEYSYEIGFILNETLKLSKVEINGKYLYDVLNLYGFTMISYSNEFIFIIAERQNILKKLGKKMVRTTGIQISTSNALSLVNEFHQESKTCGKEGLYPKIIIPSDEKKIISLDDIED